MRDRVLAGAPELPGNAAAAGVLVSLPLDGLMWAFACFIVVWIGLLGGILSLGIGLAWSTYAPASSKALVRRALATPVVTIVLGALGLVILQSEAARPALDQAALSFVTVSGLVILGAPVARWPRGLVPWSAWWLVVLLGGLVVGAAVLWLLSAFLFSDPSALFVLSFPGAGLLAWIVHRVLRR